MEEVKHNETSILRDIFYILLKIVFICLCFVLIFIFIYGIFRSDEVSMKPAVQDGDVIIYYRLDKKYVASDLIALKYKDKTITSRVVAVAGDTVDITDDGLIINGAVQQEHDIKSPTTQFSDKIKFPITLEYGQVFVLGDNREYATDSRIFGPLYIKETYGKVIALIRRRNF